MTVQISGISILEKIAEDIKSGGGKNVDPLNATFGRKFDSAVLQDRYNLEPITIEDLRNPSEIEAKLFDYMKNEGIEVYIIPNDATEMFTCTVKGYKAIYLCPKDIKDITGERILALAHELGHAMDLKFGFDFSVKDFQITAYSNEELIKSEVIAWGNAKVILETLGYDDWVAYMNETIRALNTYIIGGTEETIEHLKKTGEYLAGRVAMKNNKEG